MALKILNDMSATEIRPSALTFKEAVASLGKASRHVRLVLESRAAPSP